MKHSLVLDAMAIGLVIAMLFLNVASHAFAADGQPSGSLEFRDSEISGDRDRDSTDAETAVAIEPSTSELATGMSVPSVAPPLVSVSGYKLPWPAGKASQVIRATHPSIKGRKRPAIDFGLPKGIPILAMRDGIVTFSRFIDDAYHSNGLVIVDTQDGFCSAYAHLAPAGLIPQGTRVKQGDEVGRSYRGGVNNAIHLHLGVFKNINGCKHYDEDAKWNEEIILFDENARKELATGQTVTSANRIASPSDAQLSGATRTTIILAWKDNSNNEQSFIVDRREWGGRQWSQSGIAGRDSTQLRVNLPYENVRYCFRVHATAPIQYGSAANSGYSNEVCMKVGQVRVVSSLRLSILPLPVPNGSEVAAAFTIHNVGDLPVMVQDLIAGARYGSNRTNTTWASTNVDFPAVTNLDLGPRDPYQYRQQRTVYYPGCYFVEPAMRIRGQNWGGIEGANREWLGC